MIITLWLVRLESLGWQQGRVLSFCLLFIYVIKIALTVKLEMP